MERISTFPDSVLVAPASEVTAKDFEDPEFAQLIDSMIATARELNAFGLAAPQVGVPKKLFVMRTDKLSSEFIVFINPKILVRKDRVTHHGERCLSVPGKSFSVPRFKTIVVDALDRNGKPFIFKTRTKIMAFVIQHEMDHLEGLLVLNKGREEA
jgi:peptide deformylase